jgi:hypothetical protein
MRDGYMTPEEAEGKICPILGLANDLGDIQCCQAALCMLWIPQPDEDTEIGDDLLPIFRGTCTHNITGG